MTVPIRLYNSTTYIKYIIDAIELNTNFDSLASATAIDSGTIRPRHISTDTTDTYVFPASIVLGVQTTVPSGPEGSIFYVRNDDGSGNFYGIAKDDVGLTQFVLLG